MWLQHYKLSEDEQKLLDMSKKDFDSYMMENYADMFVNRHAKEGQTVIYPMNFGFEIGPGWRHILDDLCRRLKAIQDLTGVVCVFDQIKEKYGTARFYHHIENKEEGIDKSIFDIIDCLVSHYEEYTDYVCEELGTNVDPNKKIQMGSWIYGMGIEGFEKWEREAHPESAEDRIKIAKEYLESVEKRIDIKEKMYYFSMDELKEVDKVVEDIVEKRKARKDAV